MSNKGSPKNQTTRELKTYSQLETKETLMYTRARARFIATPFLPLIDSALLATLLNPSRLHLARILPERESSSPGASASN